MVVFKKTLGQFAFEAYRGRQTNAQWSDHSEPDMWERAAKAVVVEHDARRLCSECQIFPADSNVCSACYGAELAMSQNTAAARLGEALRLLGTYIKGGLVVDHMERHPVAQRELLRQVSLILEGNTE